MVVTRTTRNRFVQRWARGFESPHLRHQTESGRNSRSRLFFYRNEKLTFQPIETDHPSHQTESGRNSRSRLFFYRNERLAFQPIETDLPPHQTESGRSSRSRLFLFIEMSGSRFSQSKLTNFPTRLFVVVAWRGIVCLLLGNKKRLRSFGRSKQFF